MPTFSMKRHQARPAASPSAPHGFGNGYDSLILADYTLVQGILHL